MPNTDDKVSRRAPTPTTGDEGSDLRSVAHRIEGLLDDDGQYNLNPDQISRGHPDYDPDTDSRNQSQEVPTQEHSPKRDQKGRFQKQSSEDQSNNAQVPNATEDEQQVSDDQTEDTDTSLEPGDTDEDQSTSAIEEATDEQAVTEQIQTLTELAEALELPIDELKQSLTHSFRAAEEDVTVTLAELEAGYQKDADYRRRTGELAEARRAVEQDYQLKMQQFEQQHVYTAQTMNGAEQMLMQELNSDALAQLRQSDPAEWSARREEIGQRIGVLRQQRQQAAQHYEQFQTQQRGELKTRETQALKERIPDFGPDHVQLARKTMQTMGFQDPEISQVMDHRMIVGVLELATLRSEVETLRSQRAQAKDTVKRVKKEIPKLQKPGKKQMRPRGINRDNVARLRERAKKSGSVQDAAKVIETMFQ